MSGGTAKRVAARVAVAGEAVDVDQWLRLLAARDLELERGDSLPAMLAPETEHGLAFVEPSRAAELARAIAARPDPPPVTLLIGDPGHEHPQTRLVRVLAEAKREWQGVFDAVSDVVALLDSGGLVLRANLALGRMVDQPIEQLIGAHYAALVGTPLAEAADPIAASLADGRGRTAETRFASLPRIQQVTTSPMLDGHGRLHRLVVILKDVSELREHRERLLQAVRLAEIGQLAAGVAHEINTPLASIALRAESLLRSAQDPRLQALDSFRNFPRYLQTIDEEIFRCKRIIDGLLEFSRSRKPEVRETDLNALVEKAAGLLGHQMRLKQVTLSLKLDPQLPRVPVDDGQFRQVLVALLMNALEASSPGGRVEVETLPGPEGMVSLLFSDNGKGIPEENLDKVFAPFFTTKPPGHGTGLGLSQCHGVVSSHGGEIRLESWPGSGTRVSLTLPLEGRTRSRSQAAREDGPGSR